LSGDIVRYRFQRSLHGFLAGSPSGYYRRELHQPAPSQFYFERFRRLVRSRHEQVIAHRMAFEDAERLHQ
jgi:hypothetical protein